MPPHPVRPTARRHPSTAHRLSYPFHIDPAYSAGAPFPAQETFPLSIDVPGPLNWLYGAGDIEAYLLARMKLEGFRDSKEVAHPGLFRAPAAIVYFRANLKWKPSQRRAVATIRHTGVIRISINGKACLHHEAALPAGSVRFDLAPHLRPGNNTIDCVINSLRNPATLCFDSALLKTDRAWRVSHDGQRWCSPTCVAALAGHPVPHLQPLPTIPLRPAHLGLGLYGIGTEAVASLEIKTKKTVRIRFIAGESAAEARSRDDAEQITFRARSKPGQMLRTPTRALSHFTLGVKPEEIDSIVCRAEFYPVAYRGAFASGDERLSRIWTHSAYTLRTCMRELLVDGIKRDRMPWVGDLYVAILSNAVAFHEPGLIRQTLVALAGLNPRQIHANGIIDYTLYWLLSLERFDWHFGDAEFVRNSLGVVEEMLAGLEACESPEGWLMPRPEDWLFLDWAEMKKTGAVSALQFLYVWALRSTEQLALRMNCPDLVRRVRRKRFALEARCQRTFWDARRGAFLENFHGGKKSNSVGRHANFLAVLSGVATPRQKKAILIEVLNNPAVKAVGTPYMRFFENLARARLGDFSGMVTDLSAYWGGMLDAGATTFWEAFDPAKKEAQQLAFYERPFGRSLCHAWASGPAYLLSQELCGLRMLAPQWKSFSLAKPPRALLPLHVAMPTRHGCIIVDRTREQTRVTVPRGTNFHRRIPSGRIVRHHGPCTIDW